MDLQLLSTLIQNGKITPHLSIFLNKTFSFSKSSIDSTTWITLNNYKGGFIKNSIVKNALVKKRFSAITLNKEVIYSSSDLYSTKSDNGYKSWLELITHEQFHRHEIQKMGWLYWYFRYGIEALRYGYRNAPSEKRAYEIAMGDNSKMKFFLNTDLGNEFIAICQNENFTQEQKNKLAQEIALSLLNK